MWAFKVLSWKQDKAYCEEIEWINIELIDNHLNINSHLEIGDVIRFGEKDKNNNWNRWAVLNDDYEITVLDNISEAKECHRVYKGLI